MTKKNVLITCSVHCLIYHNFCLLSFSPGYIYVHFSQVYHTLIKRGVVNCRVHISEKLCKTLILEPVQRNSEVRSPLHFMHVFQNSCAA